MTTILQCPALQPITIAGGGLAGLTLGIGLRQRGVPVKIFEAGQYPRHRVCGEFISGLGQTSLKNLGLLEKLRGAGARTARTAAFFSGNSVSPVNDLPETALCISRFTLDSLLAAEFRKLGGDLNCGSRWTGKFDEGIVRASGRRIKSQVEGWRFFGIKAHAQNVDLAADLEMHFLPDGYVGLCGLDDGKVNICGLFRSRTTLPDLSKQWRDLLKGPAGSSLEARLADAKLDEQSFCSVAGLSLASQKASAHDECSIGDAITMIPPVTGNGMSMAFESAELALEPLVKYSAGEISWSDATRAIAYRCDDAFRKRLAWAGFLQTCLFRPLIRDFYLLMASRIPFVWSSCFFHTR